MRGLSHPLPPQELERYVTVFWVRRPDTGLDSRDRVHSGTEHRGPPLETLQAAHGAVNTARVALSVWVKLRRPDPLGHSSRKGWRRSAEHTIDR